MSLWSLRARAVVGAVGVAALLSACTGGDEQPSPSPSASASVTPSAEPTPSASATASVTPSAEPTPSATPSPSATETTDVSTGDVAVVVSRAAVSKGMFEVGGYVDGVVEDGGTCTVTLTSGGNVVEFSGPGLMNASTTSCGAGLAKPAKDVAGTWTLTLTYTSADHEGTSAAMKVEIP
ncbi:hypothetical protein [Demequina maris]|uniref:hypothetical protein n=1 Tax=Demequina maris TaxID=1638982 RepID=UPI0012E05545|nr:hypothetical protein [Demequina maris]